MRTNVKSIANQRDLIKRKKRLKGELKLIILKSLLQHRFLKNTYKAFIRLKLTTLIRRNTAISNQQNVCVYSGKKKTTFKISSLSRQYTKRFIEQGLIQNIRIK
jgi:hypothetical protein